MIRKTLRIKSELGLHARAAAKLVKLTSQFESDIKFQLRDSQRKEKSPQFLAAFQVVKVFPWSNSDSLDCCIVIEFDADYALICLLCDCSSFVFEP